MSDSGGRIGQLEPLFLEDFQDRKCDHPGCSCQTGRMFLHARCHPKASLQVFVEDGKLTAICGVCREFVCAVKIASRKEKLN